MKRSFKQSSPLNSQIVIALLLVFEAVVCLEVGPQQAKPEHLNQPDLSKQAASILSNYHSDAETLLRSNDLEKKETPQPQTSAEKKPKVNDAQQRITKLPKFEEQLKLVKRSPRNYNFGLGKRSARQEALSDDQIRDLLNYLYNLDFNLILNYLNSLVNEDVAQPGADKFGSQALVDDDDQEVDQNDKYKAKRDIQELYDNIQQRSPKQFNFGIGKKSDRPSRSPQRLYGFGIGKRSPQRMYEFGLGKRASFGNFDNYGRNRLEEYIKRRYSFGIGKRSAE